MENLQLPTEKLLFLVAEMWKKEEITDSEKSTLKEMIINEETALFKLLEGQEVKVDEKLLKACMIELVRPKEKKLGIEIVKKSFEPPEQDDVSSPLGNSLFERKKRHSNKSELLGLAEALKSTDTLA